MDTAKHIYHDRIRMYAESKTAWSLLDYTHLFIKRRRLGHRDPIEHRNKNKDHLYNPEVDGSICSAVIVLFVSLNGFCRTILLRLPPSSPLPVHDIGIRIVSAVGFRLRSAIISVIVGQLVFYSCPYRNNVAEPAVCVLECVFRKINNKKKNKKRVVRRESKRPSAGAFLLSRRRGWRRFFNVLLHPANPSADTKGSAAFGARSSGG